MALTPVEIRHLKPAKSIVGGYRRMAVDDLLNEIALSFEDVWRERADLADKVEFLESDLVRYRELEALLRTTLSPPRRPQSRSRTRRVKRPTSSSRRRAPRLARSRAARSDHDRLLGELRRMRSL